MLLRRYEWRIAREYHTPPNALAECTVEQFHIIRHALDAMDQRGGVE